MLEPRKIGHTPLDSSRICFLIMPHFSLKPWRWRYSKIYFTMNHLVVTVGIEFWTVQWVQTIIRLYCKVNIKIPPPPPIERKIWHYNRANSNAIKRSMENSLWSQQLNLNTDPNWQVKIFHEIFLNIMSSFIPNEINKCVPRDPPWINKSLTTLLKKKNRLYYKKHGYKGADKIRLESFRTEYKEAVESAKLSYQSNLGSKPNEPGTTK